VREVGRRDGEKSTVGRTGGSRGARLRGDLLQIKPNASKNISCRIASAHQ
jgi:hypothetical protein